MAEEAPAPPPAKAPKKKTAAPRKDGPSLSKLIISVLSESNERKGQSVPALKKALRGKGVDVDKANKRINSIINRLVKSGIVTQTTGSGASGSLKIMKKESAKKTKEVAKKSPAKDKKPVTKKPVAKKPVTKKPVTKKTATKKPAAKKPAAKKVTKPSPKKAVKKPAAKRTLKKASPKKAVKKTSVKKTAAKQAKK